MVSSSTAGSVVGMSYFVVEVVAIWIFGIAAGIDFRLTLVAAGDGSLCTLVLEDFFCILGKHEIGVFLGADCEDFGVLTERDDERAVVPFAAGGLATEVDSDFVRALLAALNLIKGLSSSSSVSTASRLRLVAVFVGLGADDGSRDEDARA